MSEVYTASGSIKIDASQAISAFERVQRESKNTTNSMNGIGKKISGFGAKMSSFGNKMATRVSAPILALGVASFKMASDLNENLNKTEVVFKGNSKVVEDWSKKSIEKIGIAQSTALEMASKFGDMGTSMGLSTDKTKEYSMGLTQLAGDLASFKNISIDRADTALTGVYTGETEALKGLGIVMTQVNLQQFAESQGIHKKIKDMSQVEQVQLRYNYIMAKTKDAQGDFARTGDQTANAMRKFSESSKQLGANIGTKLLPMFTPFINKANSLIVKLDGMSEKSQKNIIGFGLFAIALAPVLKILGSFTKAIGGTIKFIGGMPSKISKAKEKMNDFGKACKGAGGKVVDFSKGIVKVTKSFVKLTIELAKNTANLIKNGAMWIAQKVKMVAFKTAQVAVTVATKAMTVAQKALNLAMEMNPIGIVILALTALATVFITLYNKCDWFRNGVNQVWSFITNIFRNFSTFLNGIFTRDWTKSFGVLGNILNAYFKNISNVFNGVKQIFSGVIEFVKGVFTGNWSQAWHGVVSIFGGIMGTLGAVVKAPLNAVIGLVNMAISGLNKISVTIPNFVPGIGGQHFGVNIPHMNYLYDGAVFDKPTLLGNNTVVGDNYKGAGNQTEFVLPDRKLKQSITEAVRSEISNLAIIIDGEKIGHVMAKNKDRMDMEYSQLYQF